MDEDDNGGSEMDTKFKVDADDLVVLICHDGMVKERVLRLEGKILAAFHGKVGYSAMWAIAHEGWTVEDVDGNEVEGWTRAEMLKAVA